MNTHAAITTIMESRKLTALMFYCWALARVLQHPIYIALYIVALVAGLLLDSTGVTHGYSTSGDVKKDLSTSV